MDVVGILHAMGIDPSVLASNGGIVALILIGLFVLRMILKIATMLIGILIVLVLIAAGTASLKGVTVPDLVTPQSDTREIRE